MHGFFTMVDLLPGARDGLDFVTAAIDDHLAPQRPAPEDQQPAAGAAALAERRP